MTGRSEPRKCGCCGHIYQYHVGKSPELCDPCYKEGCMNVDKLGCKLGREAPKHREERASEDWQEEWDKATRPYLHGEGE